MPAAGLGNRPALSSGRIKIVLQSGLFDLRVQLLQINWRRRIGLRAPVENAMRPAP